MLGMILILTTSFFNTYGSLSCFRCTGGVQFLPEMDTYLTPALNPCEDVPVICSNGEKSCVYGIVSFDIPNNGLQYSMTGCYAEYFPKEARKCFSVRGERKIEAKTDQRTLLHANYCLCFEPSCNGANFRYSAIKQQFMTPLLVSKGAASYYSPQLNDQQNRQTTTTTKSYSARAFHPSTEVLPPSSTKSTIVNGDPKRIDCYSFIWWFILMVQWFIIFGTRQR